MFTSKVAFFLLVAVVVMVTSKPEEPIEDMEIAPTNVDFTPGNPLSLPMCQSCRVRCPQQTKCCSCKCACVYGIRAR